MRVEGYVLSLYCNSGDHAHQLESWDHFTDKKIGSCRRQARKKGWKLSKNKYDLCPDCHKKLKKQRIENRRKKYEQRDLH